MEVVGTTREESLHNPASPFQLTRASTARAVGKQKVPSLGLNSPRKSPQCMYPHRDYQYVFYLTFTYHPHTCASFPSLGQQHPPVPPREQAAFHTTIHIITLPISPLPTNSTFHTPTILNSLLLTEYHGLTVDQLPLQIYCREQKRYQALFAEKIF